MANKQITNLGYDISKSSDVINLGFADQKYLHKVSNTDLDMDSHKIKDLGTATRPDEAVNKQKLDSSLTTINNKLKDKVDNDYVDSEIATSINTVANTVNLAFNLALERDGSYSMIGNLNLNNNKLINMKSPTDDQDGVNKKYLEDTLAKSHLISSHKTNAYKYLLDQDESSSECNIRVNGIFDFIKSPHQNKKKLMT